jgi:hypothetical protein
VVGLLVSSRCADLFLNAGAGRVGRKLPRGLDRARLPRRWLLADDAYLYIGSANAMNLRAGADDEFKGGWELLKFLPRGENPARVHAQHAPLRSGTARR